VKRLEAIQAAGELGVGFTLATHDMEIRGAGELLGDDQSGQIEAIGFSLYMDMLDRAVKAIRDGRTPNLDAPLEPISQEVNLHASTLIPDDYLPDVHARLILYKRIASAPGATELDDLFAECVDRFGLPPDPLKRLFKVTALKLQLAPLGVVRLDLGNQGGRIEFAEETPVEPITVIRLVQKFPSTYRLEGATTLRVTRALKDFDARIEYAYQLLDSLAPAETHVAANA